MERETRRGTYYEEGNLARSVILRLLYIAWRLWLIFVLSRCQRLGGAGYGMHSLAQVTTGI